MLFVSRFVGCGIASAPVIRTGCSKELRRLSFCDATGAALTHAMDLETFPWRSSTVTSSSRRLSRAFRGAR